jgi:hypothetical protein
MKPYSWTPAYIPTVNTSPKLYNLVRNIHMASCERDLSMQSIEQQLFDDQENIVSVIDESIRVKV